MKLLKVMIIDDEILAIKDLEKLISWEELGSRVVATATRSARALELYQHHYPQIVWDIELESALYLNPKFLTFGKFLF